MDIMWSDIVAFLLIRPTNGMLFFYLNLYEMRNAERRLVLPPSINIIVQTNDEKLHKIWTTSSIYVCMYRILGIHGRIIIRWFDTCCHNRNPICADYLLKYEKWLRCVCACGWKNGSIFLSIQAHVQTWCTETTSYCYSIQHPATDLMASKIMFVCFSIPYTQYIHAIIVNLITSN